MATRTGSKIKLTPKQEAVKRLLQEDPKMSVGEIAERLNLAAGTVYQYVRELRGKGIVPKVKGQRGRKRTVTRTATKNEGEVTLTREEYAELREEQRALREARRNGNGRAEDVVNAELESVLKRIEAIRLETEKLSSEEGELGARRDRLSNAASALAQ